MLADFWGCPSDTLRDLAALREGLCGAAEAAGATILETTFHHFPGGGVTGVVAVKESHITIHTWPESAYAAVDIFLCGRCVPSAALEALRELLHPGRERIENHTRSATPPSRDAAADSGEMPRETTVAGRSVEAEVGSHGRGKAARKHHARHVRAEHAAEHAHDARAAEDHAHAASTTAGRGPLMPVYGLTIVLAACSIVYELLLAQTLSALLGNTVLRYSITIGCYLGALGLGAMLCGHRVGDPRRRLLRIELGLSALGGLSVPLFHFFDMGQRYFFYMSDNPAIAGTMWPPWVFFGLTHLVIVGIGLLSGFEVPLLLELAAQRREGVTNRVLGVDYLGALIGSVLFPLFLLRTFGLLATGFGIAALNAVACAVLALLRDREEERRPSLRAAVPGLALAGMLVAAITQTGPIESYFLDRFYFMNAVPSFAAFMRRGEGDPPVERHRSSYQSIDIVRTGLEDLWAFGLVSDKLSAEPDYPTDVRLYLDRDYQVYSGMDEVYHEWFVHAPIQAVGHPPRNVLVVGGGDGLAIRELVKYKTVRQITQVELDPEMIWLADHHPLLTRMNGKTRKDPRVKTVLDDAFDWLRRNRDSKFDAIYIDLPYPRSYDLAQVFSREFYVLARRHLTSDGFLILDAPDGDCRKGDDSLWPVYQSTLDAAGFQVVVPVLSRFDLDAPDIAGNIDELMDPILAQLYAENPGRPVRVQAVRKAIYDEVDEAVNTTTQEFLLALPDRRSLNTDWVDMGVPLYAFGPEHLPLAFYRGCPDQRSPSNVNSVFRPHLPVLKFVRVATP